MHSESTIVPTSPCESLPVVEEAKLSIRYTLESGMVTYDECHARIEYVYYNEEEEDPEYIGEYEGEDSWTMHPVYPVPDSASFDAEFDSAIVQAFRVAGWFAERATRIEHNWERDGRGSLERTYFVSFITECECAEYTCAICLIPDVPVELVPGDEGYDENDFS